MILKIKEYNRIIIIGNSGSGKSYLSKQLAVITGLPLIHLDNEYWHPNWEKPPREEWLKKQNDLIQKDNWIIDGNYNGTMKLRFRAAELIVFLDMNRLVCMLSALKRDGTKRSDLPDYLEERLDHEFFDFCKWIWTFSKTGRKTILALHNKYPHKQFFVIKNRRALKKLLQEWKNGSK